MSPVTHMTIGVAADTTITVERESHTSQRPQGLALEADHPLRVGSVEASHVVLWTDTSPERVEVRTTDAGDLRIWNVWRDSDLIQAWVGDARIVIDDHGDDLGLQCHDGHPGVEPDLVVRLSFDRAWTQPATDHDEP
ncbi:MAG: hypothetical protein RIB98_03320 [Acidimicrobiales bacterium]